MSNKGKIKNILPFIFLALSIILLISIGTSLSKFIMEEKDNITGGYTDFILEHDGNGKSIILQKDSNSNDYIGYIEFNVYNYRDEQVSARDVKFNFATPTDDELSAGAVDDGWGTSIPIKVPTHKGKYQAEIVGQQDSYYTLEGNTKNTISVRLQVTYTPVAGDDLVSGDFIDHISMILITTDPYESRQVIDVNISNSLISFGIIEKNYFDFSERQVTINTSSDFSADSSNYNAKLEFYYSNVIFDEARFKAENANVELVISEIEGKITISNIKPSSQIVLHFYTLDSSNQSLKVKAFVNDEVYEKVSGLGDINSDETYNVFSN